MKKKNIFHIHTHTRRYSTIMSSMYPNVCLSFCWWIFSFCHLSNGMMVFFLWIYKMKFSTYLEGHSSCQPTDWVLCIVEKLLDLKNICYDENNRKKSDFTVKFDENSVHSTVNLNHSAFSASHETFSFEFALVSGCM